ncbi:MAG: TlpA family protein disulfide reductase [Ardenticatenales bacterium]|nr:TlpA family protein disulfide reductase [Ardenticatenales bacterium]
MTTQTIDRPTLGTQRPWWMLPALVVVLSVLGLLAYGLMARGRGQLVDGPAPDFTLQSFAGEPVTLSELRGQPVILNFWASWCRECDKEMRLLESSYQRYQDEIVFLGIDYIDTEDKARAYLEQYGITYPNGPDLGSRIANDYRIKGVPETFFIGKDGTVRGVHIGPLAQADLEAWIEQLRNE